MAVDPQFNLWAGHVHAVYPFQVQPVVSIPDFAVNMAGGAVVENRGTAFDIHAGCAHHQRLFVPHHQRVGGSGYGTGLPRCDEAPPEGELPSVYYDFAIVDGGSAVAESPAGRLGYDELLVTATEESEAFFWAHANICSQGVSFWVERVVTAAPTVGESTSYVACDFGLWAVASTDAAGAETEVFHVYRVILAIGWQPVIQRAVLTAADLEAGAEPVFDDQLNPNFREDASVDRVLGVGDDTGPVFVSAWYLNGKLQISVGASSTPYVLDVATPRGRAPLLTDVQLVAEWFTQLRVSAHPTKVEAEVGYGSGPVSLGFAPDASTPPRYELFGLDDGLNGDVSANWVRTPAGGGSLFPAWPAGSEIAVIRSPGIDPTAATQYYHVTMRAPVIGTYAGREWAHWTPGLTRVVTHVDGITDSPTPAFSLLNTTARIHKWVEEMALDLSVLSFRHTLTATVDNVRGIEALAAASGITGSGNIALFLEMTDARFSGWFPQFMGMCETYDFASAHNWAEVTLHGEDHTRLLDEPIPDTIIVDGYYHYAAVAHYLMRAGVAPAQMAFAGLVNFDNPFQAHPSDPDPYFLPVGYGRRPWTQRGRAVPIRQHLLAIQRAAGCLLYCDREGMFQYHRWLPSVAGSPQHVLTAQPSAAQMEFLGTFRGRSSTRDVRNVVVLIGIDPWSDDWAPIVSKREDTDSIYGSTTTWGTAQPRNFIGTRRTFAQVSPLFASLPYASRSADEMIAFMRTPEYSIDVETWPQPQIAPLSVLGVQEWKSGAWNRGTGALTPFFVTRIRTEMELPRSGGARYRTSLCGRYLPTAT